MTYKNWNIIKRIMALALVLTLIITYLPIQVIAYDQKNNDDQPQEYSYEGYVTKEYTEEEKLPKTTVADFVAVTEILNVPTETNIGIPLALTGDVYPYNATNQSITWSIADAGDTGAYITGDTLHASNTGTVVVRATVENGMAEGIDLVQYFNISVFMGFVATESGVLPGAGGAPWTITGTTLTVGAGTMIGTTANFLDTTLRQPITHVEFTAPIQVTGTTMGTFFSGDSFPNAVSITGLQHLDVSNVEIFNGMFNSLSATTVLGTSDWNVSNATSMDSMFSQATIPAGFDISGWDVSSVTSMGAMFSRATIPAGFDISGWDTSNVTNMNLLFERITIPVGFDISDWDVSAATIMGFMFLNTTIPVGFDISGWDTSAATEMQEMFHNTTIPVGFDISGWDVSAVTDMNGMFVSTVIPAGFDISGWDTSSVINMQAMFGLATIPVGFDISGWNVSNVITMPSMFFGASLSEGLNLSGWDTASLTNMSSMFANIPASEISPLTLGPNFSFVGTAHGLADAPTNYNWVNVGTGTITSPQANHRFTTGQQVADFHNANPPTTSETWILVGALGTINYELNGGNTGTGPLPNPANAVTGNAVALSTDAPTHPQAMLGGTLTDVRFIGWTSTQHTTILPIDGTLPTRITTVNVNPNETTTVWALWGFDTNGSGTADILESATIVYELNGGNTGTGPLPNPATVVAGNGITLSTTAPTHPQAMHNSTLTDVVFIGWTSTQHTTILPVDGTLPTRITTVDVAINGTATVWALWGFDTNGSGTADILENATIVYELNGGNTGTGPLPNPATVVAGNGLTLSTTAPTHPQAMLGGTLTDVVFIGWTSTQHTAILPVDGTLPTRITTVDVAVNGTATVWALWGFDTNGSGTADILENATIVYELNGGNTGTGPLPNPATVVAGNGITLSTTAPTHPQAMHNSTLTDVVFIGWTSTQHTTILPVDGTLPTRITTVDVAINGTATVWALWGFDTNGSGTADILENATIVYELNGGNTGTGPLPNPATVVAGNGITLSTTAPTHPQAMHNSTLTDVVFIGWTSTQHTTILPVDGTLPTRITTVDVAIGGTATVWALWGFDTNGSGTADILESATIVYELNGGNTGTGPLPNPATVVAGNGITLSTTAPTHPQAMHNSTLTDVVFIGWTSTQHTTILPVDGTLPTRITTVDVAINGTATVWALWGFDTNGSGTADILESATIIYELNGGNTGTGPLPNPMTVVAGNGITLSTTAPTHPQAMLGGTLTDVVFIGWTSTQHTTILPVDGTLPTRITAVDVAINATATVWALWGFDTSNSNNADIIERGTITYKINGGNASSAPANATVVAGTDRPLSSTVPTHPQVMQNGTLTNVTFVGWSLTPIANILTATAPAPALVTAVDVPLDSNVNVYAVWRAASTTTPPTGSIYDLVISKQADTPHGGHVIIGHTVTYTISARNSGNYSLSNIVIQDIIPSGMTLVPNSAVLRINNVVNTTIIPSISGNTITWTMPSIAAADTITATFEVTVNQMSNGVYERVFRNTATVAGRRTNTVELTARRMLKNPDRLTVNVGETLNWTLQGFHNPETTSVANFTLLDRPGLGMNFQSGSVPAFTGGAGITYEIRYRVAGDTTWHTHATGINANAPFNFSLPQPGNIYYTDIGLFFGTVPVGFALGNEVVLTFIVSNDAPGNTLINRFFIRFSDVEKEGSSPQAPTVSGGSPGAAARPGVDVMYQITPTIPFSPIHHAYMIGDANGMVRPNDSITRAEVATIFFRLIDDEYRAQMWSQQNPFSDVQSYDWFNNAVSTMTNAGVFTGMPDDTFQPQRAITRAEFAVAMTRFFTGLPFEGPNMFPDVEDHWAAAQINAAARMGWITGFPGGSFVPDRHITRAEAVALINRVLGRLPQSANDLLPGMATFVDNMDTNTWFYLHIQEATNSNLFEMHEDGIHKTWTELIPSPDWSALERPYSRPWNLLALAQ